MVCSGSSVASLTSTAPATGGTGTFAYQWEASTDNTTWTAIGGATSETFTPGPLTATTYFRRQVRSGGCTATPSNTITITVVPAVTAGSIGANQAICAGGTAAPLTSETSATGGSGTIDYQWEFSTDNTTWLPMNGATGSTFVPGQLTTTTYFRRRASSGSACAPVYSNTITIAVAPAMTAGTIAADQTLCPGATPAPLTSTAAPTGGVAPFTYQWEASPNNSTWTAIAGATGESFAPGVLTATTYYRRGVMGGPCGPIYTPAVTLTVLPALIAGSIGADQTVCAGAIPAPLTSTASASGGTGTFSYQWQSSSDNTTWTAIGGATAETFAPGPLTATMYFRRLVSSGACSATSVASTVGVNARPVTPTLSVQYNGSTTTLTSSATTGNQFYLNGVAIVGATAQTYVLNGTTAQLGAYTVVTTNASGCSSDPSVPLTVTSNGKPLAGTSLSVYPNPTPDGRLQVELTGYRQGAELTVLNALGQVVFITTVTAATGLNTQSVNLGYLPSGVYTLRVKTVGGLDTRRIVRE
ncbi:T9SS type A sorting domain-containing protein [Hymenobacter sediminis]|uniref:T9SS type A sorting domain-containing protein n=1 Tax=Hymenobacter sediminis TaxID=2218621 RepID=UPI003F68C66B